MEAYKQLWKTDEYHLGMIIGFKISGLSDSEVALRANDLGIELKASDIEMLWEDFK